MQLWRKQDVGLLFQFSEPPVYYVVIRQWQKYEVIHIGTGAQVCFSWHKKLWLATCQLLSELRTRVTDDLVSVAAVVPLQGFGCAIGVHETVPDISTIVDGRTLRVSVETSL